MGVGLAALWSLARLAWREVRAREARRRGAWGGKAVMEASRN
jgi:hypothetical protein